MARENHIDVTETELAVMEVLWGAAQWTARGVTDRLYPRGGVAHYQTVKKLLERLEAKGFVRRETGEVAHRFSAAVGRDELIGRRLRALADRLSGGSMTPLLTSLVRSKPLKASEIDQLRALIDEMDRSAKGRNSRK
jgi:BlaI family penicillinase repressor